MPVSIAFLYTSNKQTEEETRHSQWDKKIKYLKINLAKEFKDLYNENFKTLKKLKTPEDRKTW